MTHQTGLRTEKDPKDFLTMMASASACHHDTASWQWIFYGNIVVPTGNPFHTTINSDNVPHTLWLGPGLKLCLEHVLIVNHDGIIIHFRHQVDISSYEKHSNFVRLSKYDFLCPGFIDLHIHAPQFAFTGTATDRPLMGPDGWLETYTFPAERSLRDDLDRARQVYDSVVRTTLDAGTTTAVYFATLDLDPCQVLVDVALEQGQRAFVGKVCMDRNSPEDYSQSLEQNVEETCALIEYIHKKAGKETQVSTLLPLVMPIVTPRFIPTCTPELMQQLGNVAEKYKCHIQSHISESLDEVAFSRHLDATMDLGNGVGRQDAEILDSHKLLTNRCIMAHGPHLSDACLDLLRSRGSAVAHCPLSNFFFAGGAPLPCRRLMERENKVGLGTDVAGGYSPSMATAARMAVIASRALRKEESILDYRHAFYLSTVGGAEALGLQNRIGTFAVGMEFDAMVLSASWPIQVFDSDEVQDVFQKLCTLGDDRHVKQVYIQGRFVGNRAS